MVKEASHSPDSSCRAVKTYNTKCDILPTSIVSPAAQKCFYKVLHKFISYVIHITTVRSLFTKKIS